MFNPELALSTVYFEKQESGSQLCVLHCLNNVLQGPCFSVEDLVAISTELDKAERALLRGHELLRSYAHDSLNLSETGFFSVQVLEAALGVYGVHWQPLGRETVGERAVRSAACSAVAYGALLLHQSSHWFALRRFGKRQTSRRWVLLDSLKTGPEIRRSDEVVALVARCLSAGAVVFGIPKQALPETLADQSGVWETA